MKNIRVPRALIMGNSPSHLNYKSKDMKYYFLKSVTVGSQVRMRFLEGQKDSSGKEINSKFNVKCSKELRTKYPVGDIFWTDYFADSGKFYSVGKYHLYHLDETATPSSVIMKAWSEYYTSHPDKKEKPKEAPKEKSDSSPKKATLYDDLKKKMIKKIPTIEVDGFYIDQKDWLILLRNIKQKINTLMTGPTGSGKTSIIKLACEKLGLRLSIYDMGSMFDPVSGLLGVHRLQEGGVSVFDYAKFTEDIQKPGVILLDELSRAPVTSNNILFPCLDDRRTLPVEIAGGKDVRSIPVHPEVCFIATANIGSEYTGTMILDRALQNRFFPLELGYLKKENESAVLQKRSDIGKDNADLIVTVANQIRDIYRKQEISCSISTRETLMISKLVSDGWSLRESLELVLLPLYEGTNSDGERGTIKKILMAY
jgi:MoxR-like ATPase